MRNERAQTQMSNGEINALARAIDQYFDSRKYEGMPLELAIDIEQQRTAAHAQLTRRALASVLDGWQ